MSNSLPSTEVYSRINHKEPEALRQAKLTAARYWKFSRDMLFSMRTTPVKGLGTMAVDKFLNLYYDPEYIERHSDSSIGERELASCLLHEMCHILMGHHRRFHAIVRNPTKISRQKWNEACDITVNYLLDQEWSVHREIQPRGYGYLRDFRVGWNWLMHDRFPYEDIAEITGNQTTEKIFRILMKGIDDGQGQDSDIGSDRSSNTGENSGSPARSERQTSDDPCALGNLVQEKEKMSLMTEEIHQLKGAVEILANQLMGVSQGTANAMQAMDQQLNQMRQQQMASYRSMNPATSSGMGNQYQSQGQEGMGHQ